MRKALIHFALFVGSSLLMIGCAGPEMKMGRGIHNVTELTRLVELRRSMEQTALWDKNEMSYTTGVIRGINRSLARTAVGAYEILTFPFPSYDPIFLPEYPVGPDNYRPQRLADPTFGPDSILGFSGGDVAPMVPGSRFRIFDY